MNNLIFKDGDIPSTYFPVGRPEDGGTCAYATEQCWELCPSSQVTNLHEVKALKLMKEQSATWLTNNILRELKDAELFQWYVWGDCLPELTKKTAKIMKALHEHGIKQFGFTRNKALWDIVSELGIRIGLTVNSEEEAIELSKDNKLVCWPDFDRSEARLHVGGVMVARCSGWWCVLLKEPDVYHNSSCGYCLYHKEGCFKNKSFKT